MVRIAFVLALAAGIAACTQIFLVQPQKRTIADVYSVEPQIEWSAIKRGKFETWTVDGEMLQSVRFINGLRDHETLFEDEGEKKRPQFRSEMSEPEVMEFFADSLGSAGGAQISTARLRPIDFGGRPGFRFDFDYRTPDGLAMHGIVVGTVHEERLYLIVYTGAAQYYFSKYRDQVEALFSSVRMI